MAVRSPLKNDSGNLKEMSSAEVTQIVNQIIYQYSLNPSVSLSVVSSGGSLGTSGTGEIRGTGMSDTRLNGSGNYQTRQVSDDYRAQEFPDGTPTSISTYYLRIQKS